MSSKRFYSFKCISYLNEDNLLNKLNNEQITQWVYIKHDKDITEKGEPKAPHFHVLVVFKSNKSIDGCRRYFEEDEEQNTLCKVIEDIRHDFRYLRHLDDKDKFQYGQDDLRFKSKDYWLKVTEKSEYERASNTEFVEDLTSDTFSYKEMAIKYGKDFMRNRKAYMEYRIILRAESRKEFLTFYDEDEIRARAEDEQRIIIQGNQFKQYYGEQESIPTK